MVQFEKCHTFSGRIKALTPVCYPHLRFFLIIEIYNSDKLGRAPVSTISFSSKETKIPNLNIFFLFQKMTQWGLQLLDLTYPITSMFSGRQFNQTIRGTFGDVHIEDLCKKIEFSCKNYL